MCIHILSYCVQNKTYVNLVVCTWYAFCYSDLTVTKSTEDSGVLHVVLPCGLHQSNRLKCILHSVIWHFTVEYAFILNGLGVIYIYPISDICYITPSRCNINAYSTAKCHIPLCNMHFKQFDWCSSHGKTTRHRPLYLLYTVVFVTVRSS
jgi:hypothetical protein